MEISRKDLEAAFAKLPVEVTSTLDVFTSNGTQIHSFRYPVSNAESTARRFWEHLATHREREEPAPWAEEDEVVDAHVCCEHAGTDPEIALMAHTLAVLRTLDADTVQRYRQWVDERFVRTHPF